MFTYPNANDAGIPSTERLTKDRSVSLSANSLSNWYSWIRILRPKMVERTSAGYC
jgi:hypothetical protein